MWSRIAFRSTAARCGGQRSRLWRKQIRDLRGVIGVPYGIRTRAANVKGWCPRPLDERDLRARGLPAMAWEVNPLAPPIVEGR